MHCVTRLRGVREKIAKVLKLANMYLNIKFASLFADGKPFTTYGSCLEYFWHLWQSLGKYE